MDLKIDSLFKTSTARQKRSNDESKKKLPNNSDINGKEGRKYREKEGDRCGEM